jgi:predicted tellurium resistance membrane protein TerC
MAVAANYIAKLLERHHWIAYIGLLVVAYVAGDMIYRGVIEVAVAAV